MYTEQEKARAIVYGLALGDALGWPVEFYSMRQIKAVYGERGILQPPDPALFTDDTQMTIAISEALLEAGEADVNTLMAAVSRRLIAWSKSPENNRAPGRTVMGALGRLNSGIAWQESGSRSSKGCGSAIRVAPIGFLYQHDPERLREVAHVTGIVTHAHPAADAATIAAAYLIKLALDGIPPSEYIGRAMDFTKGISDEFESALERAEHVGGWDDEFAAITHIGDGWVGDEAVAMAVYCTMRYPDDYVGAVRLAANIPGDSDSVACITGGIIAGRVGLEGLPQDWIARLERLEELTNLADRLAVKKQSLSARQILA